MNTYENVTYLSRRGVKDLKKAIARLERSLTKEMNELRELDKTDGHDERLARVEKLSTIDSLEGELNEKKLQLENVKLLPRKRDALRVALGSVVELVDQQGRMMRYTLVNSIEANPADGRISVLSPLGQNLLGKTVKDTVEWTTNRLQTQRLQLIRIA